MIHTYKQKSELNKQCLIYNQAWGKNIDMTECILSANTEDTSEYQQLNQLVSTVKRIMITSQNDVKDKIVENT